MDEQRSDEGDESSKFGLALGKYREELLKVMRYVWFIIIIIY